MKSIRLFVRVLLGIIFPKQNDYIVKKPIAWDFHNSHLTLRDI